MRLASERSNRVNTIKARLITLLKHSLGADQKAIDLPKFEEAKTLEAGLAVLGLNLKKIKALMQAAESNSLSATNFTNLIKTVCDFQIQTRGDFATNLLNLPSAQENGNILMHMAALNGWTNSYNIMVNAGGDFTIQNNDEQTPAQLMPASVSSSSSASK